MKLYLVVFLFIMLCSTCIFSQKYCRIKTIEGDTVKINVNGIKYTITKSYKKVKTHFPEFDTLMFSDEDISSEGAIICNFKWDSTYAIIGACCATLDIVQAKKIATDSFKFWMSHLEEDFDNILSKIQGILLDSPHFIFKTKNTKPGDTIYVWNADAACMPRIGLASGSGCDYGDPNKCYYWTNINFLTFFHSKNKYKFSDDKHICEYDGINEAPFPEDDAEMLGTLSVRLFDNKKYIVTYDAKTKKITIEYAK